MRSPAGACEWTGCWAAMPHEHDGKGTRMRKPPEPRLFGAVVAGDGREWIRHSDRDREGYDWVRAGRDGGAAYARWADMEVIRVLHRGRDA